MKFIETTSPDASTGYLEHVINVWEEKRAEFHDKLAELYLSKARVASPDRKDGK